MNPMDSVLLMLVSALVVVRVWQFFIEMTKG
jgi:hypothetical protein